MNLNEWAIKWGIPFEAVEDLRREFGILNIPNNPLTPLSDQSETAVQVDIRLEASRKGLRMWRNNVGMLMNDRGVPVRYGLANESKQMNKKIKSGDLIGIRPILITEKHIGHLIGQFVSRECKPGYWQYSGKEHEIAQLKWSELVVSLGGDAAFANREGTL